MLPADQALVQKCLSAALTKVYGMQKNLSVAKNKLQQQEKALYETTPLPVKQASDALSSPSILDGDVDMSALNDAIKRLSKGCDCPNLHNPNFPTT
jgi:hypothetical protein